VVALAVIVAGMVAVSAGVAMIFVPAGVIAGGMFMVIVGVYLDLSAPDSAAEPEVQP
jgi:hypothetical protein